MISATPELAAFFAGAPKVGVSIPLVTITLADGTVHRWARWATDVSFGGTTWYAHASGGRPRIKEYRWRSPVGVSEIGTCEMTLECGETASLDGGTRLTLAAGRGVFRDATLLLERAYTDAPGNAIIGKLFRFYGRITGADPDSQTVHLSVANTVAILRDQSLPKTLITAACGNALYDVACGLTRATYTTSTTTLAGCTTRVLNVSGTWTDGYWDIGSIALGSPVTARRGVRASVNNALTLTMPLAAAPAPGVAIALTLGCDHTTGPKGCARFANLARYRGAPQLPEET